jgi:LysM repeat protein
MPSVSLSLPVLVLLIVLLMAISAGAVFAALRGVSTPSSVAAVIVEVTETASSTATASPTPSLAATATATETPRPTDTPEPPIDYTVSQGEVCSTIARTFGVSVDSINRLNGINCDLIKPGQQLKIPRPTATQTPEPTVTLNATQLAARDCEKIDYLVQENDTLGKIAGNYAVSAASVRAYNSLPSDIVYLGQKLIIPLCEQQIYTPTPTPIPPYPAPNLLLPADGAVFAATGEVVTLQWSAAGTLRANEAYAVMVENLTQGDGPKPVQYVTDTKLILPSEFHPGGGIHTSRWSVTTVRQAGPVKEGETPVWESAGSASALRVFSWGGN